MLPLIAAGERQDFTQDLLMLVLFGHLSSRMLSISLSVLPGH